jgi:hypothetical protein
MMKNKIKFTSSLPKTVYTDIVGLPTTLLLGLTIHYYNHSDNTLYMQIVSTGTNWSGGSVNLGSLATGTDAYQNLDNFMSRTKPSSALNETITLTLNGYSDSGYTTLVYTFSRTVTMIFIKSDDGTWTTDYSDNFDNGTVQGWSGVKEAGHASSTLNVAVVTDYVLSTPNSLKVTQELIQLGAYATQERYRLEKGITTPDKTTVYAIFNIRVSQYISANGNAWSTVKNLSIAENTTVLIYFGKAYTNLNTTDIPIDKWIRVVVPLTVNTPLTLKIITEGNFHSYAVTRTHRFYTWLDDFKIISK